MAEIKENTEKDLINPKEARKNEPRVDDTNRKETKTW